jgi:putative membrane protein
MMMFAAVLIGCGSDASKTDTDRMSLDSTPPSAPTIAPAGSAGPNDTAAPNAMGGDPSDAYANTDDRALSELSDANIFAKLDAANTGEIEEGNLALQKSRSSAVKRLARMIVDDHTRLKQQGQALARQLSISPMMPPGDRSKEKARQTMEKLRSTSGSSFDSLWTDVQVTGHVKTLDELDRMESMARHDSLKTMIIHAKPVIRKHLDQAREVQRGL